MQSIHSITRYCLACLFGLAVAFPLAADNGNDDQKIRAILLRWIDKLGGAQCIYDLRGADYLCQINYGSDRPSVELHVRSNAKDCYRYDYELPVYGRLTQAYDGNVGWQHNDMLGSGPLSREEHVQNLLGINFRSPLRVPTMYPSKKLLPDEIVGGVRMQVLAMEDTTGVKSKWYFDAATGLRVKIEIPEVDGGPLTIEYADFRRVGLVLEPFRTTRTQGDRKTETTILWMLHNEDVDPVLLSPPLDFIEETQDVNQILLGYRNSRGLGTLGEITSRVTKEVTHVTTSGLKVSTVISQKLPNLIVMETDTPGMGKSWEGYDSHVGWAWSELQGYRVMKGTELQQMLNSTDLQGAMRLYETCPLRKKLDEREEQGRRCVGISLATIAGPAGKLYFDAKTGQLLRMETAMQAGASGVLNVIAEFSDFRRVDGLVFPFRTVVTNPAMQMITTVESITHNVPLEDAVFQPRKEE